MDLDLDLDLDMGMDMVDMNMNFKKRCMSNGVLMDIVVNGCMAFDIAA